jgi:hypothetical protein
MWAKSHELVSPRRPNRRPLQALKSERNNHLTLPVLSNLSDKYNPFVISHCRRSILLEKRFQEFNRDFFNDGLPKYQVLLCSKSKRFGHETCGYCLSKQRKVLIRAGMGQNSMVQTLVHEIAHAKLSRIKKQIHGKRYIGELKRLRKLGAPLSSQDLDKAQQREPLKLTKKNVQELISDALLKEGLSKASVPRFLEQELMLPFSEINKIIDVRSAIARIAFKS